MKELLHLRRQISAYQVSSLDKAQSFVLTCLDLFPKAQQALRTAAAPVVLTYDVGYDAFPDML